MDPIVIIGSGLAGYGTAREFRKLNREAPLVIVTADSGHFYSKPRLSNALAEGMTPAAIRLNSAQEMAAKTGAVIRTQAHVDAIDPADHSVRVNGETLRYSKLVFALGADPIRLKLEGNAAHEVLSVNNLDDYARFRAAVAGKRHVVVLGAGLIGCEFANDLLTAGFKVSVVDLAAYPLPRLLPPAAAAMLARELMRIGLTWHFNTRALRIEHFGQRYRVTLSDGTVLDADIVLSAVGLVPHTALAKAAGIKTNSGIVVDRYLATSAPNVFALGDCAEVEGLVLPFVMPIAHAARALASTLAGKPTTLRYPAMPVLVKTPACPTIVAPPLNGTAGTWRITEIEGGIKSMYVDCDERLIGFALNGSATAERAELTRLLPAVLP